MKFVTIFLAAILFSSNVFAAGFEKSVMWSGRYGGVGNAAVAAVRGSEAIYFNPAGLATGNPQVADVALNISATMSEFSGPHQDNIESTSDTAATFPFGVTAAYNVNKKLAIGAGAYVAAGSEVLFNDVVVVPGYALTPDFKTSLQSVEMALGAGYKVTDELTLGLAWRAALASGDFWAARASGANLISFRLNDLEDQQFNGFKVGATYSPGANWGVGLMYRSEMKFDLEGTSSGENGNGAVITQLPGSDSTARVIFPAQYALGGFIQVIPNLVNIVAEYSMTEYSKNKTIGVDAQLAAVGDLPDITLNWKDQHQGRIGVEYFGLGFPLRAGYVFTSAVAVNDNATPSLTPPGAGHTLTVGTGHALWEQTLMLNLAGEYTMVSGDVPVTATVGDRSGGEYSATAYAAHFGVTYAF